MLETIIVLCGLVLLGIIITDAIERARNWRDDVDFIMRWR